MADLGATGGEQRARTLSSRSAPSNSNQLVVNSSAAADAEAVRELFKLKDSIYKKVNEIFTMLKKGEDEA